MFGFFKKKEVVPPPIREEIIIPKEHVQNLIKLYSESTLYSSLPSYGLKSKYELWSLIDSAVGKEIADAKKKHPKIEKFSLTICLEDILHPKVVMTEAK